MVNVKTPRPPLSKFSQIRYQFQTKVNDNQKY